MTWIIENWYIAAGLIILLLFTLFTVYKFLGLPTKEQVSKIKQWLLLAVAEAERELGNNTGKLKLRYVYDMFITKFSITAKIVSFELFSMWVDDVLVELRYLLETNSDIKTKLNTYTK